MIAVMEVQILDLKRAANGTGWMWEVKIDDVIMTGQTNSDNNALIHLSPNTHETMTVPVDFEGKGIVAVKEELQKIYETQAPSIRVLFEDQDYQHGKHVTWAHPTLIDR